MASKNIKGITIEIGGNTVGLEKALKDVNDKSYKLKSELKEVEKALKLDPTNVTLLAQKQELLSKSIENAKIKLDSLRDAQGQVENQFKNGDIGEEQYRAFQREIINSESELRNLEQSMQSSDKSQNNFKASISALKSKFSELKDKLHTAIEALQKLGDVAKKIASASIKALETGIKSVTSTLSAGVNAFSKYSQALGAAMAGVAGLSTKAGATFEASMSKVQSLSGATGDDLKMLEEKAKQMGASTSKSATESADALGYMALAGWDTQQMMSGLEPILRASEAGGMDLATCSDLVTDSMSSLGVTTDELSHYLDVCAVTQSSANTSMQGLLEAYVGCGGTLKNMNVPLEESATLLGVLANRGIKGSEAGTSLNSVLVNLMGVSGQASEALNSLGVSMYESDGSRKTVTKTLKELDAALKSCGDQSRDAFTAMIGGKTQMDTLQALLGGLNEEYGELYIDIKDCNGALGDIATTMQNNVQGAFTALSSAAEGTGLAIYDTFKGYLKDTLVEVTGYVSSMTDRINTSGITGLVGAFNGIKTKAISYIIKSIPEILDAVASSSLAFNSAILSAVDVIIGTLPQLSEKILPSLLTTFFQLINKLISRLPQVTSDFLKIGGDLISGIADGMQNSAVNLVNVLPAVVRRAVSTISTTIPNIFETGVEILTTLISGIVNVAPMLTKSCTKCAGSIVSSLINTTVSLLPNVVETGFNLLTSLLNGIVSNIDGIVLTIVTCIDTIIETVMKSLPDILQSGVDILLSIIDGIIDMLPSLIDTVFDLIVTICDTIFRNLDKILKSALDIIIALCNGMLNNLDKIFATLPKVVIAIVNAIIQNLDKIIKVAVVILITIGTTLIDYVFELTKFIPDVCTKIVDKFKETNWKDIGKNIMNSVFDGIIEIGNKAYNILKPVINSISQFINKGLNNINDVIRGINNISIGDLRFNIPYVKTLPMLAKGGILSQGSAIVGEAGAELLTIANGKAIVQPLTNNSTSNISNNVGATNNYYSNYNINAKISNDYDVRKLSYELEFLKRQNEMAVGR